MPATMAPEPPRRSAGLTAMTAFFVFGASMAGLAAAALLFPQSALDEIWRLNPDAKLNLLAIAPWGALLMIAVSAACATVAVGIRTRASWGRQAAIALLAANLIGDTANAVVRGDLRTLIGLPIGGALIAYLLSRAVRDAFRRAR